MGRKVTKIIRELKKIVVSLHPHQPPLHRGTTESDAQVAESVDALVSNTSAARHAGSIPALGTENPS